MNKPIRIGTRRSQLALWQAHHVYKLIQDQFPNQPLEIVEFVTQGDRILDKSLPSIGGKGLFTLELEEALRQGELDIAVHSLKDLPTQMPHGFVLGAIPPRAIPFDALITRNGVSLDDLQEGALIGTSSMRRAAQLKAYRVDFQIKSIRGNVETRLRKVHEGEYDATILAMAGLDRLGKLDAITQQFAVDVMLPAPGQGAIAVQSRQGDMTNILSTIDHYETRVCVTAERAFLSALEAGCSLPVSAYAQIDNGVVYLQGRVSDINGLQTINVMGQSKPEQAPILGIELAKQALDLGAEALLASVKDSSL